MLAAHRQRILNSHASLDSTLSQRDTPPAFALGDGPAVASNGVDPKLIECPTRGEAADQRMSFSEIERTKYSHFGTRENYTVSVPASRKMAWYYFVRRDAPSRLPSPQNPS
jgi:hypothetical protein